MTEATIAIRRVREPDWAHVTVQALLYSVSAETVSALSLHLGDREAFTLGSVSRLLPQLDELREELHDPLAIARARVPRLMDFAESWGRQLIPPPVLAAPPDVLVMFPHSLLHDIPLHLIICEDGEPLGTKCGMTYSSSSSLFARCLTRNPARMLHTPNDRLTVFSAGVDILAAGPDRYARLADSIAQFLGAEPTKTYWSRMSRSELKFRMRNTAEKELMCLVMHGYIDPNDHRLSGLLLSDEGPYAWRTIGPRQMDKVEARRNPTAWMADVPFRMLPTAARDRQAEVLTIQEMELEEDLEVELVILLGCSAGLGEVLTGDRPASVAEVFLDLGAPTVLAPLWDIDFTIAERWMRGFLTAWAGRGQPKALAFREAVGALLADGFGLERVGAFALKGDWM